MPPLSVAGSGSPHRLEVAELLDARGGELAPVAGILDAPERQLRVRHSHAFDKHRAGIHRAHQERLLGSVPGPGRGAQAEGRLVRDRTSYGGWLADEIQRRFFDWLDQPIERVTGGEASPSISRVLERAAIARTEEVVAGLERVRQGMGER